MVLSPVSMFQLVHQAHWAAPLIVLKMLNLIDAVANKIHAETALPAVMSDVGSLYLIPWFPERDAALALPQECRRDFLIEIGDFDNGWVVVANR